MALKFIREFIKLESSAGIILFITAMIALIIDNTSLSPYYTAFFQLPFTFTLGYLKLSKPLLLWINDGFMALFFLLVGLEIKREMLVGGLNSVSKAMLPAIAAIGGMLVPAAIYLYVNSHDHVAFKGWAIPTATDTAFSLAILSLLGQRIPVQLKIFLTALAIFDDIGAIIVMAIFYSASISWILLFLAMLLIAILCTLNYFNVRSLGAYFLVGFILWVCVLKSGVHATLAGIILAFTIPLKNGVKEIKAPLNLLEEKLHPWVAFGILPIFAFANAGVSFKGVTLPHFFGTVPMGIALGLFLGKQAGIWGATMLAVRAGIGRLPQDVTGFGLYGLSLTAGVGFTMSLFIGTLAFHSVGNYAALVRMGVILGSFISGFFGYWILRVAYQK